MTQMNEKIGLYPCMGGSGVLVEISLINKPAAFSEYYIWWDGVRIEPENLLPDRIIVRTPPRNRGHVSVVELYDGPLNSLGLGFYAYIIPQNNEPESIRNKTKKELSTQYSAFLHKLDRIAEQMEIGTHFSQIEVANMVQTLTGMKTILIKS